MKRREKKEVLKRLNYLIGHLQGNKRMVEEDKYCVDIIHQNQAAAAALTKTNKIILQSHLETCVAPAVKSNAKQKENKVFNEIAELFEIEQKL